MLTGSCLLCIHVTRLGPSAPKPDLFVCAAHVSVCSFFYVASNWPSQLGKAHRRGRRRPREKCESFRSCLAFVY